MNWTDNVPVNFTESNYFTWNEVQEINLASYNAKMKLYGDGLAVPVQTGFVFL